MQYPLQRATSTLSVRIRTNRVRSRSLRPPLLTTARIADDSVVKPMSTPGRRSGSHRAELRYQSAESRHARIVTRALAPSLRYRKPLNVHGRLEQSQRKRYREARRSNALSDHDFRSELATTKGATRKRGMDTDQPAMSSPALIPTSCTALRGGPRDTVAPATSCPR
jgi:hypothetical protein